MMKRLATKGAITLASAVFIGGLAFIALFLTGSGPFSAHANPGTHVGLDITTADNTATSLGTTIDACLQVNNDDVFDVDLYATEVIDLRTFEAYITYTKTLLNVTGNDVSYLLASQPGSNVVDLSDPASDLEPDSDGLYFTSAYDLGAADSGSGVLARLTLQADSSQTGISDLDFFFTPYLTDANFQTIPISRVIKAAIAVGVIFPDLDVDNVPDPCDNCPGYSNGDQTDTDLDGAGEPCDNCPSVFNPDQADWDGNGTGDACEDSDGDGIFDSQDNCPLVANPLQTDTDGDALGDACDDDDDGDTILDGADNCPLASNPDQTDTDATDQDGDTLLDEDPIGDANGDTCPGVCGQDDDGDTQTDEGAIEDDDEDGLVDEDPLGDNFGDTCDPDDDEDGFPDSAESICGSDPLIYTSTCEVCDDLDNDGNDGVDEGFPDSDADTIPDCRDPDIDTDGDGTSNFDDLDCDDDGDPDPGFNDGFPNSVENWTGTDSCDACPDNPLHQAWAPDFDNSTLVNVIDVVLFKPVLGSALGGPDPNDRYYDRRYDLTADATINILDVVSIKPHLGITCS